MAWYTGVTDFFRGAFGEDEEEKKRRKQREAQEAAQRRNAQQQQKQQVQAQRNQADQGVRQLFGNKSQTQPKPELGQDKPAPQLQQSKPTPQAPRVQAKPLPDQTFKGISEQGKEDKKILGIKVGEVDKVKVDRNFDTNKDKYVAQFDKLDNERKKILIESSKKLAAEGDQAAANTLRVLELANRIKNGVLPESTLQSVADAASVPGRSIMRVGTGVAQGASGLYDLFTPGKGTNRTSKFLDQVAKNQDESAKEAGVETPYKVGNVVGEIASYFIPAATAEKVASKVPRGAKLTEDVIETIAKGIDDAEGANKVRRFLADRMRQGWTLDRAIEESLQSLKYTGENASKGNKTTPTSVATDVGTAVAGSLLFPGRAARNLLDNNADEAFGELEQAAKEGADEATNALDEARRVIDDPEALPFQKKRAEEQLANARKAEEAAQRAADPTMKPTFQHNQEIAAVVKQQEDKLNKFVNGNPELTAQQIEAAREATQKQTTKLVEDLQAGRRAGFEATQQQADTIAKTAEQQAQTNADVAAERVAASTPPPTEVAQEGNKVVGSPEVTANDAYRKTTDEILKPNGSDFQERGRLSIPQLLSPDRIIRENVTRPVEAKVNQGIQALQTSDNRIARGIGRFFTGFSREAGITPELQTARMQLRGGIEKGKVNREAVANLSKGLDDNALADVWATIDTEQAARMGRNVVVEDLSPEQQALRQKLVDIRDNTTVENMRRQLITREQAANGEYIMRDYSVLYEPGSEADQFERGFRQELMGQYKGRKQVTDDMVEQAITDPTYLVGKKQAQSEAAWAIQDYSNYLAKEGIVSDVAKPGFAQLPSTPLYGDAAGKYIPRNLAEDFTGFQYDMAMVSAFNDMITAYDRWGIRQAKKQLLTIFNPAVRLGNQVTNRGIFSQLAGINPVQFNIAMQTAKKEIANGGQLYREAVEQGLTGVDITQAEFFANRIAKYGEDKNIAKKALDWTRNSYSGADDQARVAAYMVKRGQGYDPVEAARQVQRGFQDYKSVGFFYDMAAKTPIIGNAFVRFAADSIRIAKNAALDHPLRTAGTIAAWAAFVNGMSVISGESELKGDNAAEQGFNLVTGKSKSDAQKEREGRSTAPKLPFTDISMTVQTPWGEVNTARFMPWYELSNIEGGGFINKVLPIEPPVNVKDGKVQFNPQAMDDPLLGQFVQIAMDKDFRGESIQDPNVNPENADQFRDAPLTGEQKRNNVLRFLFNNNAPLGRELDQTGSAYANTNLPGADKAMEITGGKDLYGKERTLGQALFRDFGLKIEQQGEQQRKDRKSMNDYQEEKKQIDEELKGLTPAAQEAYRRLTGYYKLREEVPNEFSPGDTRKKKSPQYDFSEDKWKDLAAHPELYELLVRRKQREAAIPDPKTGKTKPIQPEFDERLSPEFRKQLIQNKMVAPGDDAELDQRMYSQPEWDYYQGLREQYKTAASQYYPDSGNDEYVDELVRNQDDKFPTKPDILKQYSAQYKLYTEGRGDKPQFNDTLKAAKEAYNQETFNWTNDARRKRGLPAITWDVWNNPTFGFDETPSNSFGRGFGFGSGRGRKPDDVNNLGELSNFTKGVKRVDPIEAQAMPQLAKLLASLQAGSRGGKKKPPLGASAKGQ